MHTASCDVLRRRLRRQMAENAYPGYVYGYPHKKAYRPLPQPVPLADVWGQQPDGPLYCYIHIPFCNQRCSFCNLFTFVPTASPTTAYLRALEEEMTAYAAVVDPSRIRRLYIGGGTPTFLDNAELLRLVNSLRTILGVDPGWTQGCIEASPETVDESKVQLLREAGFTRLSLGVQSLIPDELRYVNRRFDFPLNRKAIELVGRAGFPHFNIDLIYGLPGQTTASWRYSLEQAIDSAATSLFLYPLYVRPLTGLDRRADLLPTPTTGEMGAMYDIAVERLPAAGFRQLTMRQFRRDAAEPGHPDDTEYRCQRDGMIGLGAGARSYTQALHYSTPWKMLGRNIRGVVEEYCSAMARQATDVAYGLSLDSDEQRRRHVILSLLYDGLDLASFEASFGVSALTCFAPEWEALEAEGCVRIDAACVRLTERGVRHADVVGQVFFSERVRALMEAYEYDS
jgi:oxygen-independent coproporphyrinogen-3 oxidase